MHPNENGTSNDWLRIADLKGRVQRSPKSIKNCRSNDGGVGGAVRKPVAHYVLSALLNQTGLALVLSCQPRFTFNFKGNVGIGTSTPNTVQYPKINLYMNQRMCHNRDTI